MIKGRERASTRIRLERLRVRACHARKAPIISRRAIYPIASVTTKTISGVTSSMGSLLKMRRSACIQLPPSKEQPCPYRIRFSHEVGGSLRRKATGGVTIVGHVTNGGGDSGATGCVGA